MVFRVRRVAALLFFSGACALVYQVAWFRELRLIFGASTASSSAVLAIFMGGLGLGGLRLGKRADASANPLAMYAKLEIGVACAAGVTPALVWLANAGYLASGGSDALGAGGATLLRLLMSVLVLGPACFLMGGTLPAAARAVERDNDGPRRSVATLYGVNTLGAVVGAVLANFLLLEVLGTRLTLWIAALVNILVGMTARSLARQSAPSPSPRDVEPAAAAPQPSSSAAIEIARWFPPAASALVGLSFMLMELTWYRMLAPLLGGSSYTFGLILAVALVGIAIGGVVYARTNVPATLRWFAITCSLEALFIAVPYALGDRLAILAALLRPLCRTGFGASTAVWTGLAALVILPAAIVSGIQFPLVIGLYGRGARRVGHDVGAAYLANTVGSIVGSLAGGFGLMPLLGALGVWKLVVVSLAIGATVAALLDFRSTDASERSRRAVTGALLTCVPLLLLLATGPTAAWRHSGIGAGRLELKLQGASSLAYFIRGQQRALRWEEDGVESSVALHHAGGFNFVVNGKTDGHAVVDAPTQVMGGLLPAMLHGSPKSALVVGLGTGSTAGWLGVVPTMDRVDVVELEPAILRVARDCAPINERVLENPKVHVHLADAREYLRTSKGRYDIIFSEPSNPYRAGISSLYTVEFYRAAAERLAPGGLFVQWVQAYEIDGWALSTAIVTLRQVFGDVEVWETMAGDLLLLSRAAHAPLDVDRLRVTLTGEPFTRASTAVWGTRSAEGILSHFVARSTLGDTLMSHGLGAVNTDDQNFLEFAFARSVGSTGRVNVDLDNLSRRLGTSTPDAVGAVDWTRVIEERWLFAEMRGAQLTPPPASSRMIPLSGTIGAFTDGQYVAALGYWKSLQGSRADSYEAAAVAADAASRVGEDADVAIIDGAPPRDRDALMANWAARHGDDAKTVEALLRVFIAARTDPWMRPRLLDGALSRAQDLAVRVPASARPLYDALKEPFAVETGREVRLYAAAHVAMALSDPAVCVEAFEALEPPPIERRILEQRARCYARARHPRAEAALKDLLQVETPLGASIPTPARTPVAPGSGPAGAPSPTPPPTTTPQDDDTEGKPGPR